MRIEWSIDYASPEPRLSTTEVDDVRGLDIALDAMPVRHPSR
jgi:hypothetical protein